MKKKAKKFCILLFSMLLLLTAPFSVKFVRGFSMDLTTFETDKDIYYFDEDIFINSTWENLYNPSTEISYVQVCIYDGQNNLVWMSPEYSDVGFNSENWTISIHELDFSGQGTSNYLDVIMWYYNYHAATNTMVTALLQVIHIEILGDINNPIIHVSPNNLTVEFGYTGQRLSWNATDPFPNTYTIELQGSGIVAGPFIWTSGTLINYNIPDGFVVGVYVYTINFTDDNGNSIIDSVIFNVDDDTNPIIKNAPNDLTVELGYTGQSLSWNASDHHPNIYTIELQGLGIVVEPTVWTSTLSIIYNIPNNFALGNYVYTVNFTDDYGNSIIDSVIFNVGDTLPPEIIVNSPSTNILYGVDSPIFNISLYDINGVDTLWYTIDGVFTNFTFVANGSVDPFIVSGFIDQSIWDSLGDGTAIIGFYANDTVGNIGVVNITISIRRVPSYTSDGIATSPFEPLIIVLIIIMSIILILGSVIVMKKRI